MLTLKQRARHSKSAKAFRRLEDELLHMMIHDGRLKGNYGARFNECSYRISNLIELVSLQHVNDDKQNQMLRIFSPNPDLFHFASLQGLQTSSYLLYEGKPVEAKHRILGKIEVLLLKAIHENELFQGYFDVIQAGIAEILCLRYPEWFNKEEALTFILPYRLGE